jgi:CBS domain-containing protein
MSKTIDLAGWLSGAGNENYDEFRLEVRTRQTLDAESRITREYSVHRVPVDYGDDSWTPDRAPVASVMRGNVTCVTRDVSVEDLVALFIDHAISFAPVVDDRGYPVGVVSKHDVLLDRFENGTRSSYFELVKDDDGEEDLVFGPEMYLDRNPSVGDIMVPFSFSVSETTTVAGAAAVMSSEQKSHLPVVDRDGRVTGTVSALDALRWLSQVAEPQVIASTEHQFTGA